MVNFKYLGKDKNPVIPVALNSCAVIFKRPMPTPEELLAQFEEQEAACRDEILELDKKAKYLTEMLIRLDGAQQAVKALIEPKAEEASESEAQLPWSEPCKTFNMTSTSSFLVSQQVTPRNSAD